MTLGISYPTRDSSHPALPFVGKESNSLLALPFQFHPIFSKTFRMLQAVQGKEFFISIIPSLAKKPRTQIFKPHDTKTGCSPSKCILLTEQAGQNKVAERKTKQDCIHHNKEESQKYSISKLLPIRKHEERNEWVKESYQWSLEWIINMNVLNEQQKGTSLGSHCSNCLVYKHYEETPTIYTILKKEILLILWSPGHIG